MGVYLYNGIQLNNKKEWNIHTHYSVDESQNNYAEWKMSDKKICTVWFHLYGFVGNANYCTVIKTRSVVAWGKTGAG